MNSDFKNESLFCRTCLKESLKSTPIIKSIEISHSLVDNNNDTDHMRICDIISICFPNYMIMENNIYSERICGQCVEKLCDFYKFRQLIEYSNKVIRNLHNEKLQFQSANLENKSHALAINNTAINDRTVDRIEDSNEQPLCPSVDEIHDCANKDHQDCSSNKTDTSLALSKKRSFNNNQCIVCNKTINGRVKLQMHLVKKHYVRNDQNFFKPFQCDNCDKAYTTLANLNVHKIVHSGTKSFICDICNRAFYKKSALINHISIHTGLKRFQCEQCNRSFTSANILHQHLITHSNNRPFKCTECSRDFFFSNDLRIHMRTHTGERLFLCSICGHGCSRKAQLNTHLRIHTGEKPYICSVCQKSFAQSGDLNAHNRIHTGEKPYTCTISVCKKSFNQSSGLRAHMKSHTGERNYICLLCNKGFTQSSSLGRHMKTHSIFIPTVNATV